MADSQACLRVVSLNISHLSEESIQ